MILSQFDSNKTAVIDPSNTIKQVKDFPEVGVACFSRTLFAQLIAGFDHRIVFQTYTANMEVPIYEIDYEEKKVAAFMLPVGAPACVAVYEEIIAMGLKKLVLYGTCGVLDQTIEDCSIIIPESAIRDEGTSYHYMPPTDEIAVNLNYKEDFIHLLKEHGFSYTLGKTWTTDGFYRETRAKLEQRKKIGCICVEMECASMAAVSQFRNTQLFQFFYAADNLDTECWDQRSLAEHANLSEKEKANVLALELAAIMKQK
ncbi:uridine phosphorylase [Lachnospiraceae bacterium KM106-2]|nr:uridine phosphorylase [Lachnospiraceae bacterium KM106-2]